jgi:transposase
MARLTQYYVNLSDEEREYLRKHSSGGTWRPRAVKKALILLKADISQGCSISEEQIAKEVGCCLSTVKNTKLQFAKGDRLKVIEEKERSGRPRAIHGEIEAHIIATACSSPPEGRVRWTLHLIADKVVALTEEPCSHMAVARTLKKTNLSLG